MSEVSGFVAKKIEKINDYPLDYVRFERDLTIENLESIVPIGYSSILSSSYNIDTDNLDLKFHNAEEGNDLISIPLRLLMPSERKNIFPLFLLEVSSLLSFKFDYDKNDGYIFNQNEILYMILLHRFMQFEGLNVHYTYLLRADIRALVKFGEYNNYSSYNAINKSLNYLSIVSPWTMSKGVSNNGEEYTDLTMTSPIGEYFSNDSKKIKIDDRFLNAIFRDLPIQPASESMASEGVKFVMHPYDKELYRCAGYTTTIKNTNGQDYASIETIFPRKPNLPSRIKTHIISDCYSFKHNDLPIFSEDIFTVGGVDSDNTIKNAFVVFDEMNGDTGRLLCGEIEASKDFSDNIIYKDEVIRERFDKIFVKEGQSVSAVKGKFIIGCDEDGEDIALYGFKTVDIISIEDTGYGNSSKVIARCSKKIGSSKILSTTGLKGVTKPKPSLGYVTVLDMEGEEVTDAKGDSYLFAVDLVAGMNSVKAKSNTIFMARAALSNEMCISKNKILTSMDAEEINEEAFKIGKCKWIDADGIEKLVWFGVIQVRVNELSYMYNNIKKQKFMAESGRYLRNGGYKEVFNKIWELGVDSEMKATVLELQKIVVDDKGFYAPIDNIPTLTPNDLLYGIGPDNTKMFELEDCQSDLQPLYHYTSKMLDEEWNEGWYLDLRPLNESLGLVRMPSAKLLNLLTKELPDGRISYPVIFRMVSNIVKICLTVKSNGYRDLPFLVDIKKGDRSFNPSQKQVARYLMIIHGMIYKKKDLVLSQSKMIDVFMKPQMLGVGMKQMTDAMVPQGYAVIFDDRVFKRLSNNSGGFYEQHGYFNSLCIRNPVIWKNQVQSFKIMSKDMFEWHLMFKYNVVLSEYLCTKENRELFFINPEDALVQMSDVDGDLMPVFVIDDYETQKLLDKIRKRTGSRRYGGIEGVLKEEIEWLNEYRNDELSANDDLDLDPKVFEIYSIPISVNPVDNKPCFLSYFKDSIIAKGEVGAATIQLWAINTLLEVYKDLCDSGEILDHKGRNIVITDKTCAYIVYAYTNLIQTFIVRGIKHLSGGVDGFNSFKLENISERMSPSTKAYLLNNIKLPKEVLNSFMHMLHWMKDKDYLNSVTKYISMFNSGKQLMNVNAKHIEKIESCSFYGLLLKEMKDVKTNMNNVDFIESFQEEKAKERPDQNMKVEDNIMSGFV